MKSAFIHTVAYSALVTLFLYSLFINWMFYDRKIVMAPNYTQQQILDLYGDGSDNDKTPETKKKK